jgi:hypothetical protein
MISPISLFNLRIPVFLILLVSVSFNLFSQQNKVLHNNSIYNNIKFSHPVNYHSNKQTDLYYRNTFFSVAVPETLNVYAIRVQFKPDSNPQTTGDGRFDLSNNYPDSVDAPPHDSLYFIYKLEFLKNYYLKASKGKLFINYTLLPSVRNLPNEMQDYSPRRNENLQRIGNLFNDVWKSADSVIDFSALNQNNSAFIIFHAGVGKDVDLASQGLFVGELDIPSLYFGINSIKAVLGDTAQGYHTQEGFIINNSCILPEQEFRIINTAFGNVYLELGLNGIVVAAIGSHLGLPDLFDTQTGRTAIGRFGLMDGQAIFSFLGVFPPEPCAWEKQFLGWVNPNIVSANGSYSSKAASLDFSGTESVYKFLISGKEYFLLENRNRDAFNNGQTIYFVHNGIRDSLKFLKDEIGFSSSDIWKLKGSITDVDELDWSLPGLKNDTADFQGGILIWHIDENVIDANIASNTINNDINHRGVDLEEAKGSQDIGVVVRTPLGDVVSDGFFVDFWYNGNHYRPANIYKNEFNITSFPNSKSYSNINSRVCLSQFSQIAPVMTFYFENCGIISNIPNFPKFIGIDNSGNSQPIGIDINNDSFDEIFLNNNGSVYAFRNNGLPVRTDQQNGLLLNNSSNFIVSYTNLNIGGGAGNIIGNYDNYISFIRLNSDSISGPPASLQVFINNDSLTSPVFYNKQNEILYSGTKNGKIFRYDLINALSSADSVSNLKIHQLSLKLSNNVTSYNFIDARNKFLASSYIYFSQPPSPFTSPVIITGNNKLLSASVSGNDTVISENLRINSFNSSPVVCDLNGDSHQDIIFSADNKLFAVNKYGVVLDNFPFNVPNVNQITGGISVADLNGDNLPEVIFGTGDGRIYAYSTNGKILEGFPLLTGSKIVSTPAIINHSGNFGIVVYSEDGYLYGFKTPWQYNYSKILWKNYLRDALHSNDGSGSISNINVSLPCLPSDKVYNWPNPAYGNYTNIRYFLNGDVTNVKIKILDLSGELVASLNGSANKGFDNEVVWDISNVQSGIYIAVLELSGSCSESAAIKIAVVK